MNEIKLFNNSEFGEIRTALLDDIPMFCLTDVCRALELTSPSKVKERLDIKGVYSIPTLTNGGTQNITYINEANLYKVIFQSRKESAERFTTWVTSEVLPSIRKHGAYLTPETIEKAILTPDFIIKLATELKSEQEKVKTLSDDVERMKPKEIFADAVTASETAILVRDFAKLLKQNGYDTGEKRFYKWLRENGYVIKGSCRPTQKAMQMGLFELTESTVQRADKPPIVTTTTKISGKGQVYFINKILGENYEGKRF